MDNKTMVGTLAAIAVVAGAVVLGVNNASTPPGQSKKTPTITLTVPITKTPVDTPVPLTNTSVPLTPTLVMPTGTSVPLNVWHLPTTHEHGDEPPDWVKTSALLPTFDGGEAHVGFKGFLFTGADVITGPIVDAFLQVHLISTPSGRLNQFHSYKTWIKDNTGSLSYYQGYLNTGDPSTTRISHLVESQGAGDLPIQRVLTTDQASYDELGLLSETWYTGPLSGWAPSITWIIFPQVYLFQPPESPDRSTWVQLPNAPLGLNRSADISLFKFAWNPVGEFCAVMGGGDPVDCATAGALKQYTAPSLYAQMSDIDSLGLFIRSGHPEINCPQCIAPN